MLGSLRDNADAIRASGVTAAALLAAVAVIHAYWVAGGSWGTSAGVGGRDIDVHTPAWRAGTTVIALLLLGSMLVVLGKAGVTEVGIPEGVLAWAAWLVAGGLLLGGLVNVFGTTWTERLGFAPLAIGMGLLVALVAASRLGDGRVA